MSRYNDDYDEPQRYHTVRTRRRDADDPDYVREETYVERGKGAGPPTPHDLVYRGREDSIEDIDREFPPPGAGRGYRQSDGGPRRARSVRDRYDDDYYYDDDRYTDYAAGGAAGGAAGYAAGRRSGDHRRRRDRDRDYSPSRYSDDERRPDADRRKSGVDDLLKGLGLGGVAAALLGKDKDKDKDTRDDRSVRSRSRPGMSRSGRSYRSEGERSRSRDRNGNDATGKKWAQAAQAAVIAGAIEAIRARNMPGPWTGEKGKRIATAAFGAGGIDRVIDKNPNEKSKRHLAEAVAGGLVGNYVINGSRSKSRGRGGEFDRRASSPDGRGRSRSIMDRFRGRSASRPPGEDEKKNSGVKELVAGGALAATGKALWDRYQSKNRAKDRSRSRDSSADSYRSRGRREYSPEERYRSRSRASRY